MRRGREAGSATVLAVAGVAVVVLVLAGALVVVATVRDVHRARGAADLAALAAAGAAGGVGVDCAAGSAVAEANGAVLASCGRQADGSVLVTVTVARRWPVGWRWLPAEAVARARAGLVESSPGR